MPAAKAVDQEGINSSAASVFIKDVTVCIHLHIKNNTDCSIDVNWLDYEGHPVSYGSLSPKGSITLSEHSTTSGMGDYLQHCCPHYCL